MKFFVSGKIGHENVAKEAMLALRKAGHEITFDWTTIEHLAPYDNNSSASRETAVKESQGVLDADVLVIFAHKNGVGLYVELGIAIAANMPIRVITGTESNTIFFHHPLVKKVASLEEVIEEFS